MGLSEVGCISFFTCLDTEPLQVSDCKNKHRADLLAEGKGIVYSEPAKEVVSRSGDECVVALTDQWYLDYGEPSWLESVK